LSFLSLGAFDPFQGPSKKELLNRLEKLEKQNVNLQERVSDLERRLDIITERVNTVYSGQDSGHYVAGGQANAGPSPSVVPDLDVVRISPDKESKTGARDSSSAKKAGRRGGKVLIEKRQGNTVALVEHNTPLEGTNYIPPPDPETEARKKGKSERSATSTPPAMASRKPAPAKKEPSASETELYEEIKSLWKADEGGKAVTKMKSYLDRYPGGSHVDEVAYRLGEELYQQGEYNQAIRYLSIVTEDHPTSSYAARSLYVVGVCYVDMGRTDKAADVLREVKVLYPFSEAAKKAENKLSSCCP
jgi:TolA-binding protein